MCGSQYYTPNFFEVLRDGVRRSAEVIVPIVLQLLPARSVVDVGCGEGAWLAAFLKHGAEEVLGVDGDYIASRDLQIPPGRFRSADLGKPLRLTDSFDLAVSLEVAEHLPADSASDFIESLSRLAPAVLFSAAVPRQGGTNHVNEQWPEYWAKLFERHGFVPVDAIRKRVWQDERVEFWYAQNTLIFCARELLDRNERLRAEFQKTNPEQLALIHPRKYLNLQSEYTEALARENYLRQHPASGVKEALAILNHCAKNALRNRLDAPRKGLSSRRAKEKH
jgi:SAM-dependent methyltransferase